MTSNNYAVIDADFYIKMTKYACDRGALFLQMLKDLGVQAVMHKYVAKVELKKDEYIKDFIDSGQIELRDYSDYLISEQDRSEYEDYFIEAYERMNRYDFPEDEDIYEYACEDEGLGEIRSLFLAKKMGYHYFMSDDGGARRLATSFWKRPEVLNVYDALLKCKESGTSITLKQLNPTISNVFRDRQNKLKVLQEVYAEGE